MGQYHTPVCIEAEEGLSASCLGCGLKEAEQGFTRPGTPNAIVALVCARGRGSHRGRDVPPGRSWAFSDHRTMAQVTADEKTATA